MKIFYKNLFRYLPLLVLFLVVFYAFDADAGVGDWLEKKAARALGIDTSDNCVPPQPHTSCMFCGMFKLLYQASSFVADKAYDAFHSDLGKLIAVFLAVSLALIVLKNIAAMNSIDPGTVINDILKKTFVAVAILIITTQDYYNILNLTLVPIIKTGLEFVGLSGGATDSCALAAGGLPGFSGAAGAQSGAGLPSEIGTMIICAVDNMESKINTLFEYGRYGFCRGTGPSRLFHILPHPVFIIDGIILYLGGIFFLVTYPWVLGDAVLQLGISLALLPFAIAGYAFDGTKGYLSKVFNWILNSLFVFIFMGIVLTCLLDYVSALLEQIGSNVGPDALYVNPNKGIAFYGPNMMMILFILAIGITYMETVPELASVFSEGAQLAAAKKVGEQVKSTVEKQTPNIIGKSMSLTGGAALSLGKTGMRWGKSGMRHGAMYMANNWGHVDRGTGNMTFNVGGRFAPKWLTRGLTFSTETMPSGEQILRREFNTPFGRKNTMVSDKYSNIRTIYDKNGNEIGSTVEFKHNFAKKYLFNNDGTINTGSLNKLLSSPLASNPAYREAIMAQVAKEALRGKGKEVGDYYKSRRVISNPSNPNEIYVEQIDHNGKKTTYGIKVNAATGQYAVEMKQMRNVPDVRGFYDNYVKEGSAFNAKGMQDLLNSTEAQDPQKRAEIAERILKEAMADYHGTDVTIPGALSNVIIDQNDPNKFIYQQVDALGNLTLYRLDANLDPVTGKFKVEKIDASGMSIHPVTGKIVDNITNAPVDLFSVAPADTYDIATSRNIPTYDFSGQYEIFRDNGVVTTTTTGVCDSFGVITQAGSEVTKFKYSQGVQALHDSILSKNEAKQVVDSTGKISQFCQATTAWDPTLANKYDLMFGMDSLFGATTVGGKAMGDYLVDDILAYGRANRTNKVRTNFGI